MKNTVKGDNVFHPSFRKNEKLRIVKWESWWSSVWSASWSTARQSHPPEPHMWEGAWGGAVSFPHSGFLVKQGSPESLVRIPAPIAVVRPTAHGSETADIFPCCPGTAILHDVSRSLGNPGHCLTGLSEPLFNTLHIFTEWEMSPGRHLCFSHITVKFASLSVSPVTGYLRWEGTRRPQRRADFPTP